MLWTTCSVLVAIMPQGLLVPRRSASLACNSLCLVPMDLEILAVGEEEDLTRPCVDCGLYTGRYCDYCFAARRIPSEEWSRGQRTPLCSRCDNRWNACHFCRGLHWCTPAAWGTAADYVKQAQAKRDWKRWRDTKRPSDPSTPARR